MEQENIPLFDQAFAQLILGDYEPVHTLADSSHQMSSQEIYMMLKQMYPTESYAAADIFPHMKKAGFTTYNADGVALWLMKRVL